MKLPLAIFLSALLSIPVFGTVPDIYKAYGGLEILGGKLKVDSLTVAKLLDSAKISYDANNFVRAVDYAESSFELSKIFPDSDFAVQSVLILARSHKEMHLLNNDQQSFNSTLKYYLKAITALESAESKLLLPKIYKEYGDFYFELDLVDLTIKNYTKAYALVSAGSDYGFQKELLTNLAELNSALSNYKTAVEHYSRLIEIHKQSNSKSEEIEVLKILCDLYRVANDFDRAITAAKHALHYYQSINDVDNQITYHSLIGEISYEAGNNDQADKAFKSYFNLVKKDQKYLDMEIRSLRYIKNLITEGDIYMWSTDHGFWSDYSTAIRFYNRAQKHTDFRKHPDLACKILNRTGAIYFKEKDFKTCITYFDLALYYANREGNLNHISENHIMLARAFDAIEQWEDASRHYELHAAYKDSIIQASNLERQKLEEISKVNEKEYLRVEQTLDLIEARERQELAFAEKELRNIALENELELFRQDVALKEMQIQNRKLAEDSAVRNYQLAREQLMNERNAQKIEDLNSEREKQDLRLKNWEAIQKNERQQMKILEQENTLARSRQAYYILSIILISLVLVFIVVVYLQKRKANKKLQVQNEKIEMQSDKLKEAYKNLELLSTIGRDITSSLIIEEIIETVYENLNTLMNASVLGIGVFEKTENRLYFPGVRERDQRLNNIYVDLDENKTLAGFCFNKQREIIIDNYFETYSDYIQPDRAPVHGDGNSTSIVYLPLTISDKRLGVLTVQSFEENAFNEYHINIIRNIAIYTKIALENANVYRELAIQSDNLRKANINIGEQNRLIEEQCQQLLSINEEKNNLMKILAHDLRNPLATAMSMTELVRFEKGNLSVEQYHASEIIWRGLNRMNDMIRKILDIKAAESQRVNLDMDILDVNELIGPLEKLFKIKAESKRIKLNFFAGEEDSTIKADRHYVMQIMENLISNAIKFSKPDKNVDVRIEDKGRVIRLSVRDEGPGIPKNELSGLFKKYHRLSPKPTGGEQSIGLGLSIVKKYVEVMEGKVWCESNVGKGSEFNVEFRKAAVPVS
ncbi:MAG: ATP-binding protein [Cytophagales bacterium]|nr:ATP-binding protein [Cytophagales bacterium]